MNRLSNRTAWILIVVGCAGIVGVLAGILLLTVLDDDDGDTDGETAESTIEAVNGVEVQESGGEEPILEQPAPAYSILFEDLRGAFEIDRERTLAFGPEGYSLVEYFRPDEDAEAMLGSWGFADGSWSLYRPVGLLAGMLEGRNYLRFETYRFETAEGAHKAWEHIARVHLEADGIEPVDAPAIGNESLSVLADAGSIQNTDKRAAVERTLFRRGNLIAIVEVTGVDDLLPEGISRDYATGIDLKAMGDVPAILPTPAGQATPDEPGARIDPDQPPPVFGEEGTPTPTGTAAQ